MEGQDEQWRGYGQEFWMKEYVRFSRIFFEPWRRGNSKAGQTQRGRRLIAGLPGNHDLGLGNGIREPVRKRFNAYFGDGNRIDVLGNHTFVSLDTVSLSAKGQPDPVSGSQGMGEGNDLNKDIWGPVDHFLHLAKANKARAIERELRVLYGKAENEVQDHDVIELDARQAQRITLGSHPSTDIPSVVLSHVPLYRAPGTPCGPLRERFPPAKGNPENDDANSIRIQAGVQYQNVLTPAVSSDVVDLVGNVTYVFSGDDHDYCDIIHRGYTSRNGGVREVTVKSISWAMGIRKPGFLLLSLWNPVDAAGAAIGQDAAKSTTLQTHLCLLPDQLAIFIRYGLMFAITLLVLLARAFSKAFGPNSILNEADRSLLPISKPGPSYTQDKKETAAPAQSWSNPQTTSARSMSPNGSKDGLAVRSSAGRPRSLSPINGYGYVSPAKENPPSLDEVVDLPANGISGGNERNAMYLSVPLRPEGARGWRALSHEFRSSTLQVACFVFVWYLWLLLNS